MRSGYNPTRRNRNIGTAKQGHGRDNRLTIPSICHDERIWWEQLGKYREMRRSIAGRDLLFIVESTHTDFFHACTVDDVSKLLNHVPAEDWEGLDVFVLRQPTRKQEIDSPCWGRLAYHADLGQPAKPLIASGAVIFLEAQRTNKVTRWSASLDPDDQAELERLISDGHTITRQGSRFLISADFEAVRTTQLYRTLLHELGHWVDWLHKVVRPLHTDPDARQRLEENYFARPRSEREVFAHRYATTMRERLTSSGKIPFDRIVVSESIAKDGLSM